MDFPNIDPVALDLGFFQIRWYALAYLGGILGGWWIALKSAALYGKDVRPNNEDIENLITWAVLGVIAGGRLGYVLFYGGAYYLENPIEALYVWQGGMSFHGGLIGVVIAIIGYAMHQKISVLRLGDVVCSAVPLGLLLGRLSNFVNGELYGKPTDSPLGIVFPGTDGQPRHPSQLYEAVLEGLVLLIVTNVLIRQNSVRARKGIVAGIFLAGYGASRFAVEFVREPDAHLGTLALGLSMGQWLSVPLIFAGLGLIVYACTKPKKGKA